MTRRPNQTDNQQPPIPTQSQIYTYRNAIYQGKLNPQSGKRAGAGIIYVTASHHFIAATQFAHNSLAGNCLFYHQHARYVYGEWRDNKPDGVLVARIG
jgi:hypothetical protein